MTVGPINISGMQTSKGKSYLKLKNNLAKEQVGVTWQ